MDICQFSIRTNCSGHMHGNVRIFFGAKYSSFAYKTQFSTCTGFITYYEDGSIVGFVIHNVRIPNATIHKFVKDRNL